MLFLMDATAARLAGWLMLLAASVSLPTAIALGQEAPPRVAAATEAADAKQGATESTESPFAVVVDPQRVTDFEYRVGIDGHLLTPTETGVQKWKLGSSGLFRFSQRRRRTELSGPLSLDALRLFSEAEVTMTVGDNHKTSTRLPASLSMIRSTGSDAGLVHRSTSTVTGRSVPLTRKHLDLLQMPCDPLVCGGLMPTGDAEVGEKWNTGSWVIPMLTGLEAVVEQSVTCEMKALTANTATVSFEGKAAGAVSGSASRIDVSGELTFDRKTGLITSYRAKHREDRSAGPISPGLQVTVDVNWTQSIAESSDASAVTALPKEFPAAEATDAELALQIQTPWMLQFQHSREWHVFNQTASLVVLRQIRSGNLIAQCNLSPGVSLAPGQQPDDEQFAADVQRAIEARGGQIVRQTTLRDDSAWRIRRVRASADANGQTIFYDYYLCAAKSGEQFSFVFSHSEADAAEFGDEAEQILDTLTVLRRRPAVPFR